MVRPRIGIDRNSRMQGEKPMASPLCFKIFSYLCKMLQGNTTETENDRIGLLERHEIRPTAVRLLVLREIEAFRDTFSMADLEEALESVDKSTIFRTLTLFADRHLLHMIEDGSGSTKYCLCRNDHDCGVDELHCHFYCEACQKTFCLDHTHVPAVRYPAGFEVRQIDYLLKGLCPECAKKGGR